MDRSIMLPTNQDDFNNDPIAMAVRRGKRRKALEERPTETVNIQRIPCAMCGTSMPIEWLQHEVYKKILCVDGQIYCINCAKQVAVGMQRELIGMNKTERLSYYADIETRIKQNAEVEALKNKDIVEEVNYDDVEKMKKLMRNRSGSNDSMSLKDQITENAKKVLRKEQDEDNKK